MRHHLRTLGATVLSNSTDSYAVTSREAAFLSFIRKTHSGATRRAIVDLFWPDAPAQKARHSLSQLLYALKVRYPELSLTVGSDKIAVLDLDIDFIEIERDAAAEQGMRAISKYRGRFLPGEDLGSAAVRHWRDDVEELTAVTVSDLLAEQSYTCAKAELDIIVQVSETVLNVHPHLTGAQTALLEATTRLGLPAKVRTLHHIFTTTEAYQGIDLPPIDSFLGRASNYSGAYSTPFAGRKAELATLQSQWERAIQGDGQVVIITGEPGIGKSRLADYFLRRIAIRGGTAWVANCCAATQRLPYSVTHELIRTNIPAIQNELFSLTPDTSALIADQASRSDSFRHTLTESITAAVVARSTEQPVALLIDDAQWADEYTALLLSYWSYRLRAERVLILLTARTQEADPLPAWITSDLGHAEFVRLGRISISAAERIVDAFERTQGVTLTQSLRDAVLWQSGGRPFLLMEALASVGAGDQHNAPPSAILSESAEALLSRRFRSLSNDAHLVVGLLSAWGQPISSDVLQQMAALGDKQYATALDLLHERGIAELHEGHVSFPHDLMRETAYRALLPPTRVLHHKTIAHTIAAIGSPEGLVAQHYAAAGDSVAAGRHALLAADSARRNDSYSDHEFYCKLAINCGSVEYRTRAAGMLVRHLIQSGRGAEVGEYLSLLDDQGAEYRVLAAITNLERSLVGGEHTATDLLGLAQDIISEATALGDPASAAVATTLLCVAFDASAGEFDYSSLINPSGVHSGIPEDTQLQLEAVLAVWRGVARSAAEGLQMADAAMVRVGPNTSIPARAACLYSRGTLLLLSGQLDQARSCFETAQTFAQKSGDTRREHSISINHGVVLLELDESELARESFERALTTSNLHFRMRCLVNLAILHFENQEYALASKAAQAVQGMNASYQSEVLGSTSSAVLGLIALTQGDDASARRAQSEILGFVWESLDDSSYTATFLSRMLVKSGRTDEALDLLISTIERTRLRNSLCALRLQCEAASILAATVPDTAYVMLKSVIAQASAGGARRIQKRAANLLFQVAH